MARILIVDDSFIVQRTLGLIIRRMGHEVLTAGNGREALDTIRGRPVDLAFVDMSMPVMDGLQLLEVLRQSEETIDVRVVFLTGSSLVEDRQAAEKLGVDGFLNKPVSSYQLQEAIDSLL